MSDGEPDPLLAQLCAWASALRFEDLPDRVVALARSQIVSQLAAIRAGAADPRGTALVRAFGAAVPADPRRTAQLLGGLGSWLDLDDTAYAGHLGNSTVAVPLAHAGPAGLDGPALITAVVAANECAARVTAAATLGPFRGQTALHTSLVGAVAGRQHCLRRPAAEWTAAMGLALAMPPWTLAHSYLGSDARVLSAVFPIGTALDACDAADVGLAGPPDVLEHPAGFLARFADLPLPETVVDGLGKRWHTDTLSFKVRPCGPGGDAAVDCAVELYQEFGRLGPDRVAQIVVEASAYTIQVQRMADAYDAGPSGSPTVLPLSVPYTVATALLHGDLTVADYSAPRVADPDRWELAARTTVRHDPAMTRELIAAEAPFGHAMRQAGDQARAWIAGQTGQAGEGLGPLFEDAPPPAPDFAESTKRTGARVTLRLSDGRTVRRERLIPVGAAGPDTRARHAELVGRKYAANGGDPADAAAWQRLERTGPEQLARLLEASLRPLVGPGRQAADPSSGTATGTVRRCQ